MSPAELRADDVVTGYGKQEIVHGVSLAAGQGQITCVFGPNGSGKSTLLKAIAGALPVWRGAVRLGDQDLTRSPAHEVMRRGIVMMPQGGGLFAQLTVLDNLRMGGYALADRREARRRVEALLQEFPLLERRRKAQAGQLSGGEQMILAMARLLVSEPVFVLLDEPSAGLAPALVHDTLERVKELRQRGIGVLLVEQNIREALPVADRLYILTAGRESFRGTPGEIRDDRQLMEIYMGAT